MGAEVKTTCPYCGVGCGVIAKVDDTGTVTVKGDPEHPANFGRLCSKGSALAETIDLDGRCSILKSRTERQAGMRRSISSPAGFPRPLPNMAPIPSPSMSRVSF